jgi:integrase
LLERSAKPLGFSQTVGSVSGARRSFRDDPGGRPRRTPEGRLASGGRVPPDTLAGLADPDRQPQRGTGHGIEALIREWVMDLRVLGRSPKTIRWYEQKMDRYRRDGGVAILEELTAFEFKRYLAELQERGLAPNTVHGCFETLKAFANWAAREGYPVDPGVLRARAPKVPQQEMETYSEAQIEALLREAPEGWPRLAILILLGTGMRVGELCALGLSDIEDEGDAAFLKIQRGKGSKFRRVPVSRRLRRELVRYLSRMRPDVASDQLLLRADGRPVRLETVIELFQRLRKKVGFRVHAHKFRHTFATTYLRQGGEIERLAASSATRRTSWSCGTSTWTRATWVGTSTCGRRSEGGDDGRRLDHDDLWPDRSGAVPVRTRPDGR